MQINGETFSELVSRIYDAAFMPHLWDSLVGDVNDTLGASQVMLGLQDFQSGRFRVVAPRMDPADFDAYRAHWGGRDLLWQRTNSAPIGATLHAEAFVPRDEMVRTDIYNEWHQPLGLGTSGLGVNLALSDGAPSVFGMKRSAAAGEFSAGEVAFFERLAPHLVRAAELQRRLHHLALREELALAGLAHEKQGILLIDPQLSILHANASARDMIAAQDLLRLNQRTLGLAPPHAGAFEALQREALMGAGGSMIIARPAKAPVSITVSPWPRGVAGLQIDWLGIMPPAMVVVVADPSRAEERRRQELRARYALTKTEARFALEIARGQGREVAARRLGIALGTARTHLERIFQKTGTHSQAELARLIASGMG